MFPLDQPIISGYRFGQRTWYFSKHLGVDYKAYLSTLRAPFSGEITFEGYGLQGGNTIHLYIPSRDVTMRFMHLKSFIHGRGAVNQGEAIAITGNSGMLTTGYHLHLDISKGRVVNPKDFSNFINPETYDWTNPMVETIQVPIVTESTTVSYGIKPPSEYPKTVTVMSPIGVKVRTEPNTHAALGGTKVLKHNDTFKAVGMADGEAVEGNNRWYISQYNNYVWSGACS